MTQQVSDGHIRWAAILRAARHREQEEEKRRVCLRKRKGAARSLHLAALALVLCALFLASVARFYHPGVGFSALLIIPQGHEYEIPALQRIPHFSTCAGNRVEQRALRSARDGAVAPDPAIDRAMDARVPARGGFSSLDGGAFGLGRPA